MRLTQIVLILTILIVNLGCEAKSPTVATGFDLHGFKSVEFGMTPDQLLKLGFKCDFEERFVDCTKIQNPETLFGKPVYVSVLFFDGKMGDINLHTESISSLDLRKLYTASIGEPMVRDYVSDSGYEIRVFMWISNQKTSIAVSARSSIGLSMVVYRGVENTSKILENSTDPNIHLEYLKDY